MSELSQNKKKYLKYKNKYIALKNQFGGNKCPRCNKNLSECDCQSEAAASGSSVAGPSQDLDANARIDISIPHKIDLGFIDNDINSCVKELVEGGYEIYNYLLKKGVEITLICGGQSPSYYCLSMMNLPIYDPRRVEIIIIPHSKGGQLSVDQAEENRLYCERLREKGIVLRRNVTILDGVHSGVGILALESALKACYPEIIVEKIAINVGPGISQIPVNKEYYFKCEAKFSDIYSRLVNSYHPRDFNDSSKFITEFNISTNALAHMIISVSRDYPNIIRNQ